MIAAFSNIFFFFISLEQKGSRDHGKLPGAIQCEPPRVGKVGNHVVPPVKVLLMLLFFFPFGLLLWWQWPIKSAVGNVFIILKPNAYGFVCFLSHASVMCRCICGRLYRGVYGYVWRFMAVYSCTCDLCWCMQVYMWQLLYVGKLYVGVHVVHYVGVCRCIFGYQYSMQVLMWMFMSMFVGTHVFFRSMQAHM